MVDSSAVVSSAALMDQSYTVYTIDEFEACNIWPPTNPFTLLIYFNTPPLVLPSFTSLVLAVVCVVVELKSSLYQLNI